MPCRTTQHSPTSKANDNALILIVVSSKLSRHGRDSGDHPQFADIPDDSYLAHIFNHMVNFLVFIKVFLVCTDSNYHVDRIYPGSGDNLGQDACRPPRLFLPCHNYWFLCTYLTSKHSVTWEVPIFILELALWESLRAKMNYPTIWLHIFAWTPYTGALQLYA